ncbi:MAG: nicotinate-nucleotide adenylyltransferase [Planctomycetota bacterium]
MPCKLRVVRLGIYGGSFDPIHRGHIAAALAAREARGLGSVLLLPAGAPPHKKKGCVAPFEDRLEMARLAVAGREGLEAMELEGQRKGPSYTVDTVEELRAQHPAGEFELLVGADMLEDLPGWRRVEDLLTMVRVVAFARPGADSEQAQATFRDQYGPGSFLWLEVPPFPAASSEIRRRLSGGEDVEEWLDPAVVAYVREHGLYTKEP